MNWWNKLVIGAKFLFGGFESATDYVLKLLNGFLSKDNVAANVQKSREFVETMLRFLRKYEKYCPAIWANDYLRLVCVVQKLSDVFEDGKVSASELVEVTAAVQAAIADWNK